MAQVSFPQNKEQETAVVTRPRWPQILSSLIKTDKLFLLHPRGAGQQESSWGCAQLQPVSGRSWTGKWERDRVTELARNQTETPDPRSEQTAKVKAHTARARAHTLHFSYAFTGFLFLIVGFAFK